MNQILIIEKQVIDAVAQAHVLTVTNLEEFHDAAALSLRYKALEKEIKATFKPIKEKTKAAHDEACAQEKKHLDPVLEVQQIVDSKATAWRREEIARQEEYRRRTEEEAKRNEENLRLAEAEYLEKQGNKEAANAILERPIVTASVVKAEDPKVSGYSVIKNWDFEVTDESAVPREYLTVDTVKLGKIVKAMKDQTVIPGVRVFFTEITRKSVI